MTLERTLSCLLYTSLDSDELYTDNYLYDDTSYFESIRSLYLEDNLSETRDDEYTDQYIDVNYDTATKMCIRDSS